MLARETPELGKLRSVDVKLFPKNWRELKSRKILETTPRQALNRWANYLGNIWPECWDGGSLGRTRKCFWHGLLGHFSGQVRCSREFRSWAPNGFYTRKTADMCWSVNLGWAHHELGKKLYSNSFLHILCQDLSLALQHGYCSVWDTFQRHMEMLPKLAKCKPGVHSDTGNSTQNPHCCHLNAGVGEPWAGQVKEKGRWAGRCNVKPLISAENLGEEPPTGSGIFIGNRQQKEGWDGRTLSWA